MNIQHKENNVRTYKKKECPICKTEHTNRGTTCSKECANKKRSQNNINIELTCILCGTKFHNTSGKGKYCSNPHYKQCEICGNNFVVPKGKESRKNPTCGPKCGATYTHRNPENKQKRKENSLKKWGVEHPFQSETIKQKIYDKSKEKWFGNKKLNTVIQERYGVANVSQLEEVKLKKAETYEQNYTDRNIHPKYGKVSKLNLRWKEKLGEVTGLDWELEHYFTDVGSVDLYCENGNNRVAVEISPTVTHNSYYNVVECLLKGCTERPCTLHSKDRNYHHNRSERLKRFHNIDLVTVFDWMDETKVLSFIRSKLHLDRNILYARKTSVRSITQREANRFLEEFHMMGGSRKQTYCYGVYSGDLLVQVQTFSPLKNDGEFEAKRLATRSDYAVIGGVSKVTKLFRNTVQPRRIVAFSDLNLSWPDYDLKYNGFVRSVVNKPQKCWSKGSKMVLDKSAAWQSADRLLKIGNNSSDSKYPADWSNEQVFLAEGWLPVWDCGMIRDEWVLE